MWSGLESGSLCMTPTDQQSWKGICWDWVWIATGRSGFDTMVVNRCPFIRSEGSNGFLQCKRHEWTPVHHHGIKPWLTYQLPSTHNPTRSLSKIAGLSVSCTNYQTPPQTTFTANLKLHTNSSSNHDTPQVSTSVKPPHTQPLSQQYLQFWVSLFYSTAEEAHGALAESLHLFSFCFISVCLSDTHLQAWRCYRLS